MALPFALSTAGIVACTWWLCGQSNGSCGRDDTRSLAVPMPLSRRRLAIYGALVALTLLAVFRIVPVAAAVAVVAADARRPRPARLGRRGLGPTRHLRLLLRVRGQPGARARGVRMALAPHGRSRPARERRLKPDHQQRARRCAALPFHGRMAAPARRREHRRRRHASLAHLRASSRCSTSPACAKSSPERPRCPSYPLVASSPCSAC